MNLFLVRKLKKLHPCVRAVARTCVSELASVLEYIKIIINEEKRKNFTVKWKNMSCPFKMAPPPGSLLAY